jgi:murein DD-endopeptidase MepM/ murein hydrolase activator NlpD
MHHLFLLILCSIGANSLLATADTAYALPYPAGKAYRVIQCSNTIFSHKNQHAIDFYMKVGTPICAARGGIVIAVAQDFKKGGYDMKYFYEGNHIIIKHTDGSTAWYWHLAYKGVLVQIGDTVQAGTIIGKSGNTGYTAIPHLHFQIFDANNKDMDVLYYTKKGKRYLKFGRRYRNDGLS